MKNYLWLALLLFALACDSAQPVTTFQGEAQGTSYTVKFLGKANAGRLKEQTDSLLLAFDQSLSTYIPNSTISALNRGDSALIDTLFLAVYKRAQEIQKASDGAFDPTIGPVIAAWGFNFEDPSLLNQEEVDSLLLHCGFSKFKLSGATLFRLDSSSSLNFNAIAQGYSVDLMAELLDRAGLHNYYVELGGELRVKGKNALDGDWRIGIDKPSGENLEHTLSHIVEFSDKAMATSGNYRKFYEYEGQRYSHTIDPRTGFPVLHHLLSATVIADDCMTADAYATACMVLGLEKSIALIEQHDELEALLIYEEGNELLSYSSEGIKQQVQALD